MKQKQFSQKFQSPINIIIFPGLHEIYGQSNTQCTPINIDITSKSVTVNVSDDRCGALYNITELKPYIRFIDKGLPHSILNRFTIYTHHYKECLYIAGLYVQDAQM